MPTPPLVSIILPVHNEAEHAAAAIAQLAGLTYPATEVIVVDDASTDNTAALCQAAAQAAGLPITVLHTATSHGVAAARVRGVHHARGTYVWLCDADDEWDREILSILVDGAVRTNSDVTCCRARRHESSGRTWVMEGVPRPRTLTGPEVLDAALAGLIRGYFWNKLFRREVLASLPNREHLSSQDDFVTLLQVVRRGPTVTLLPDICYDYRERAASISTTDLSRLDNTDACYTMMQHVVESEIRLAPRARQRELRRSLADFRLWFLVLPSVSTPVHHGWPDSATTALVRRFSSSVDVATVVRSARLHPRVAAHGALLKVAGRHYPTAYRLLATARGFSLRTGSALPPSPT
ncbi:glycosyltransferase family 2 protein [Gordonia crocea]|uniref:Glycosyltransferase 2-like domain-containing protein n=1 Tax=Gordonia crocea TaxID=589162 RepID=A0A7I9V064_9ACTN|nr:glycosyltransferase family 2 protein [Gordonia crocea]GED98572.1 hypothetical protein nbrc107697_26110 [Gordonia crocea]